MKIELILLGVIGLVFLVDFILKGTKKPSIENVVDQIEGGEAVKKGVKIINRFRIIIGSIIVLFTILLGYYYFKNHYVPDRLYNQVVSFSKDLNFLEAQKTLDSLIDIKPNYKNIDSLNQEIVVSQAIIDLSKDIIIKNIKGDRYSNRFHRVIKNNDYEYNEKRYSRIRLPLHTEDVHFMYEGRDWENLMTDYKTRELYPFFNNLINSKVEEIKKLQQAIKKTNTLLVQFPQNGDLYYLKYGLLRSYFYLEMDHTIDYFLKNNFSFYKALLRNDKKDNWRNQWRANYWWYREIYDKHWGESQYLLEKVINLNSRFSFDAAISLSMQFLQSHNKKNYEKYLDIAESINDMDFLKDSSNLIYLSRKISLTSYKIESQYNISFKIESQYNMGVLRSWQSRFSKQTNLDEFLKLFIDHLNTVNLIANNLKSKNTYFPSMNFFKNSLCTIDCEDFGRNSEILVNDQHSILESSLISLSNVYFLLFSSPMFNANTLEANWSNLYNGYEYISEEDANSIKNDYCNLISNTKKLRIKRLPWYKSNYPIHLTISDYLQEVCN